MDHKLYSCCSSFYHSKIDFAECYAIGTLLKLPPCKACNRILDKLVAPLVIEWEPKESPQRGFPVPDFLWQNDLIVVSERVRLACETEGIKGVEFSDVVIKPPKRIYKRPGKVDVPPLSFFQIKATLAVDANRSKRRVEEHCPQCGWIVYERKPDQPFVVIKPQNVEADIFFVQGLGIKCCTQRFHEFVSSHEFSNIAVKEFGKLTN
jgi:hypothetical protein